MGEQVIQVASADTRSNRIVATTPRRLSVNDWTWHMLSVVVSACTVSCCSIDGGRGRRGVGSMFEMMKMARRIRKEYIGY